MRYLDWNKRIASHFFNSEMSNLRVNLYVTQELIVELGKTHGADFSDFVKAVKSGPDWVTRHNQGICQKALQTLEGWGSLPFVFPPYIGYLAFFVIAAGIEGDFDPRAYYPRLRKLLGEKPVAGQYPSFDRMTELWKDLEDWSIRRKGGEFGVFTFNIPNTWFCHVGIPISQTLLTAHERQVLPRAFMDAGVDPTSPPSEEGLAELLLIHGKNALRQQTLNLLNTQDDDFGSFRNDLLEMIYGELEKWDGSLSKEGVFQVNEANSYASLRICAKLDRISQRIKFSLRCKLQEDFPENGLLLINSENENSLFCEELGQGWSTELSQLTDRSKFDAAIFNWLNPLSFKDETQRWILKLPASPVRILVDGYSEGLPGLVEVKQVPTNNSFYILVHENCKYFLEDWGRCNCQGFEEIQISQGLPKDWLLFHVKKVYGDEKICRIYPLLALPRKTHISLVGGVRASRRNEFFKFAPPKILLRGASTAVSVFCNGLRLTQNINSGLYILPEELRADELLTIEAVSHGEVVSRCSLRLRTDFAWTNIQDQGKFNAFGDQLLSCESATPFVTGAIVENHQASSCPLSIPLSFFEDGVSIYLIGPIPGQIVQWPLEEFPEDWQPVWAIQMARLGRAYFCGTSISDSVPVHVSDVKHQNLQRWKDVLWRRRKKIFPPSRLSLKQLWKQYQSEARHV